MVVSVLVVVACRRLFCGGAGGVASGIGSGPGWGLSSGGAGGSGSGEMGDSSGTPW